MCNLKDSAAQRTIPLEQLSGLTKSTEEKDNCQFIIHVAREHDYRFLCDSVELRNETITAIKDAYFYKMNKNLPIWGVPTSQYKIEGFV